MHPKPGAQFFPFQTTAPGRRASSQMMLRLDYEGDVLDLKPGRKFGPGCPAILRRAGNLSPALRKMAGQPGHSLRAHRHSAASSSGLAGGERGGQACGQALGESVEGERGGRALGKRAWWGAWGWYG